MDRVSRKDLYASDSEPIPTDIEGPVYVPDLVFEDVEVHSEIGQDEAEVEAKDQEMTDAAVETAKDEEDEGFTFNLFSTNTSAPSKVVITADPEPSEAPAPIEGVIYVEMHRPDSYYFSHPSPNQIAQYTAAAVSGASILDSAQTPTPKFYGPSNRQGRPIINYTELQMRARQEHQRTRNKKRPGKKARAARKEKMEVLKEIKKARQIQTRKKFAGKQSTGPKPYAPPKTKGGHPRKQPKNPRPVL